MSMDKDVPIDDDLWDYIIIGGGISGLSLGALLTNIGKRVLIIEKDNQLGGRAKTIERDGFKLDNGLHLMKYGLDSPLNIILRLFKGNPLYERQMIQLVRNYDLYVGNEIKDIQPTIYERARSKWWNRGWISVPRNMEEIRRHNFFSVWKLMQIFTTGFKAKYDEIKAVSLNDFIQQHKFTDIAARYLRLAAGSLMNCPYPSVASAGEVIRTIKWSSKQKFLFGYPEGGWEKIIQRLENYITNSNSDKKSKSKILLNSKVDSLIIQDNKVEGVKSGNSIYKCNNIIITIPPKQIPLLFNNNSNKLSKELIDFIDKLIPTCGISFFIALNEKVYKGQSFLYIENPNGYGIFLSNLDPTIAPQGKQLFSAFIPLSPLKLKDDAYVKEYTNKAREYIYNMFPKMKDHLIFEHTMVHELVDSVQININQFKDARPNYKIEGIANAFLVGDYLNSFGSGGEICYNSVLQLWEQLKKTTT